MEEPKKTARWLYYFGVELGSMMMEQLDAKRGSCWCSCYNHLLILTSSVRLGRSNYESCHWSDMPRLVDSHNESNDDLEWSQLLWKASTFLR